MQNISSNYLDKNEFLANLPKSSKITLFLVENEILAVQVDDKSYTLKGKEFVQVIHGFRKPLKSKAEIFNGNFDYSKLSNKINPIVVR